MKDNGFTIVEVMVVIVIIALLSVGASTMFAGMLNDSEEKASKMNEENLADAATKCGLELVNLPVCEVGYDPKEDGINKECTAIVTVQELVDNGYFYDSKGVCDLNAEVIIYNYAFEYEDGTTSGEYRAYVKEGTCKAK